MNENPIPLFLIDIENWRFCLYEAPNNDLYCDFTYSPVSYADFSMLLKLTEQETNKVKTDRNYLFTMSDEVRENYKTYLQRALKSNDFLCLDKNDLLVIHSNSMGNTKDELIAFCEENKIQNAENYSEEFDKIQEVIYNEINRITPNGTKLSLEEIEQFCDDFCSKNYLWIRNRGIQAVNKWLLKKCSQEGILKEKKLSLTKVALYYWTCACDFFTLKK